MATATGMSLPPAPPAPLLDIQSLPSLEKFDSQLLDLIKATNDSGAAGINVMDELQAPDDDLALQRLMSLTRNKSEDIFAAFKQQQVDAAAAGGDAALRRAGAGQQLRGQLQHHQLMPGNVTSPGPDHSAAMYANHMQAMQQQQGGAAQADYAQLLAAQQQANQHYYDPNGAALQGSLADALGVLSNGNPAHLNALMETLRSDGGNMGGGQYGGNLSAALSNLGLPPVDGPSSAVAQRKRANRGTRLSDIIKQVEQQYEDGDGMPGQDSLNAAAAAAMAAAMQGPHGGSDSRDSTQGSPHAKRRKGGHSAEAAAALAAQAALASADSDYEMEIHSTSHLHITADMDEETKTKLRREKNRIAARKCRAKKNALMSDLQGTLSGLVRKNEEYKLQVATWHKMFSREVRLREAMKRIIAVMWSHDVAPAATGYTANDIIIGVESGTLDINSVLRSFAAVSAANGGGMTPTAAQAAAAAAAAGLASPTPLVLHSSTSAANTPRSPAAAAAAAAAADAAMAAAVAEGSSPAGVPGLVPQHLLITHNSHISHQGSGIPQTPHTPAAADAAALNASLVLGAAGGKGMMMGGMGGDANTLGSPIPSVAAAALVDLAGAGAGQGFGGLESQWTWGMDGGLGGTPSQVGPSCITTGME